MSSLRAILKSNSLLALVAVLLFSPPSFSEALSALGLSGSARLAGWEEDKSFKDERGYLVGGAWLQARPQEFFGIKTYFDGRLQGEDLARDEYSEGDLREAFAEYSAGAFDFKVGRQIVVWGRADKANPTDVWSVKNFGLLTTDDEDQRTGVFTLQGAWTYGSRRLIAIWQPEWRPPTFPLGGLPSGVSVGQGNPSNKAGQFGLKLDSSGGEVDWSLSYSQVIDRTPDFRVLSSGASGTKLEFNYQQIEVFGADFARSVGAYGLRGEAAYVRTQDNDGRDFFTKNPYLYAVVGSDRTFGGNLNVNLQYVYRHAFDWRGLNQTANAGQRSVAEQVNILSFQQTKDFHGASFRLSHKSFNESLETELTLFGWIDNGLIRPKVTYAFSDNWRGILGGEIFSGEQNSFFGRLKETSSAFAEVRFLF